MMLYWNFRRNGGRPVHINLTTSYSLDFSVSKLPEERVIQRVDLESKLPELSKEDIAIFVGAHSVWNEKLKASVESFCEEYNAFVFMIKQAIIPESMVFLVAYSILQGFLI
ncbi:MAG: hypothetical protein ACLTTJ_15200 [Blautia sp.]